jgi:hypothetical protein
MIAVGMDEEKVLLHVLHVLHLSMDKCLSASVKECTFK